MQEELTSTSVDHLIINPNAAYEKFRDKRLGTEAVGEPGGSGKGGLWGPRVTELTPGRVQPPWVFWGDTLLFLFQISLTASARPGQRVTSLGTMKL